MSADRNADRIVRAWLDLMPDEAPDRTVAAVLQAVETAPQARRPLVRAPWRSTPMTRFALIAAVVALGVALLGGALLVGGSRPTTPQPAPVPTAPPSAAAVTTLPPAEPVDAGLRADWLAQGASGQGPASGGGPLDLRIDPSGTILYVNNASPGQNFRSLVSRLGPDQVLLALDGVSAGCPTGSEGTYRWSLSPDGSLLTLESVSDQCATRVAALARTWGRSLTASTSVGGGFVTTMAPAFKVVLPDLALDARTLSDFVEIGNPSGFSLMAFKNPQPFVDPCSTAEERVPYQPGAAAFIEAFRANDAFVVGEATPLKIDGHDAVHVDIGGKTDYARCPGQALYEYTPKTCTCHFIVGPGGTDSMYLVEVGEDTFLFIVSPYGYDETPIIESIRIPATIPSQ